MNFQKRMQMWHKLAIVYVGIGVLLMVTAAVTKSDNPFLTTFGACLLVLGVTRFLRWRRVTGSPETMQKTEIEMTDERNLMLMHRARSAAFVLYVISASVIVIVLSFLGIHQIAEWIAFSMSILVLFYWICWLVIRRKY